MAGLLGTYLVPCHELGVGEGEYHFDSLVVVLAA
jgi:hypothetical protein